MGRKTRTTALFTWLFLSMLGGNLKAQENPNLVERDTAQIESPSEKSALVAGVLEWAVPTVGYAYAGNWKRGIPPGLVRLIGFGLVFENQFEIFGDPPPCEAACKVGTAMGIIGMTWAVVDVVLMTKRENRRGRVLASGLTVVPTLEGLAPGIRIHLRSPW